MHLDDCLHLRSEHHEAILAGTLGAVEGGVGVSEELGGRRSRSLGDTNAGGELEQAVGRAFQLERIPEDLEESLGAKLGAEIGDRSIDEHDEFIPAESVGAVGPRPLA